MKTLAIGPQPSSNGLLTNSAKSYLRLQHSFVDKKVKIIALIGLTVTAVNIAYALTALYPPVRVSDLICRGAGALLIFAIALFVYYFFAKRHGLSEMEQALLRSSQLEKKIPVL